jgi:hypothetical protein
VYFTASVAQNTFEWDAAFLSSWSAAYLADGNDPRESSTPPTVTVGSGFSAEAPGPYGSPRFPWTVGGALTVNGSDQPIFLDPEEDVVDVQGNVTEMIAANGTVSFPSGPSGQVYAAIVNGVVEAAPLPEQSYNYEPYYPFNLDNLNIGAAAGGTHGIGAIVVGQDNTGLADITAGLTQPAGKEAIHLVLTGLDPAAAIASLEVIGTAPGEDWLYPAAGFGPQLMLQRAADSASANVFLAPVASHLDDTFTIKLSYAQGGTITIPVPGILCNSLLPVFPGGSISAPPPPDPPPPAAPLNLRATSGGLTQIDLAWSPSSGASSYVVERSVDDTTWTSIATNVTTPAYVDSGLAYATTYFYRVVAVSSAGQSAPSAAVGVQTGALPYVLAIEPTTVSAFRNRAFKGAVAILTDTNPATLAARFNATIAWGDRVVTTGDVIGANGYFVVTGIHTYRAAKAYTIHVTVSERAPAPASATTASVASVVIPGRQKGRKQHRHVRRAALLRH